MFTREDIGRVVQDNVGTFVKIVNEIYEGSECNGCYYDSIGNHYCTDIRDKEGFIGCAEASLIFKKVEDDRNWISAEIDPIIPKGKHAISIIGCWDCCDDEKNIVSQVSFDKNGHYSQLAYGPMGVKHIRVSVKKWMYLPKP